MTATDAILAALTGVPTGDADGKGLTAPYRVLYADFGNPDPDQALTASDNRVHVFTVMCVGDTREQAEWVAARTFTQLHEKALTVEGRITARVTLFSSSPMQRDDDAGFPLFTQPMQFQFLSTSGG